MKILKSKSGVEIKIFSDPKEMSIGRYSDFRKYLLEDVDLSSSLKRALAYSQEGLVEDCEIEINNSIQAVSSLYNAIGIHTYAFAVLVAEIGGKQANDTTIDGLQRTIQSLSNLEITQYEIENSVEELKKK